MKVVLTALPKEVQEKIPISIRSVSDVYELEDLPPKLQELVREYLTKEVPVTYKTVFDLKPNISKYSDIETLQTRKSTVVEYLKNFFQTLPGSYPFDPTFGCKLKYHLQTKDTHLRRMLVVDEINSIVNALSSDLNLPIEVKNITVTPLSSTINTTLVCVITISIPGEEDTDITINSITGE